MAAHKLWYQAFWEDTMKRLCPVLLLCCLLLTGCGGAKIKESYQKFADGLNARTDLSFTAEIRAEYEDKTASFTLLYTEYADGCNVEILSPGLVKGIRARLEKGETRLEYGSVMLDTGELDGYGLSPMSALPALVKALREGHLDACWTEDGKTVLQLIADDCLTATVWLESGSMTPMRAELSSYGRVRVFCTITDWN